MSIRIAALSCLLSCVAACSSGTATSPTETTATLDPNTFSSQVNPGGGASREFVLTTGGTFAITLTTTSPSGVALGLGVGIPRSDGSCAVSEGVQAVAGSTPQIALTVEAARYCAKVYDPGTVTQPTTFTIVISRP